MDSRKQAVIAHEKGLHARVAAMIVQKAHELERKWQVKLYFRRPEGPAVRAVSIMPLVSLKVKQGDLLWVEAVGQAAQEAAGEMKALLESDFQLADATTISQVDSLLQDNVCTADQIFVSMANGLLVTDENDVITVFNPAAERILGIPACQAIGSKAQAIIPGSRLHIVAKTQQAELGCRQSIGRLSIITNRTPIITDGQVRGTLAIFEDISVLEAVTDELKAVKELKERLQLVLESVQDGICVVDRDGYITYVNPAYTELVSQSKRELIGQNVRQLSPQGARSQVLASGQPVIGSLAAKPGGVTLIANVSPIVVDGELTGAVSVVKNVNEVHKLLDILSHVSAKAEYLEQELRRTQKPGPSFHKFIGQSGKVREALAIAAKAAVSTATVLIIGESGTGKELVAEGIHYGSRRAEGPFIRVNCAAIPESLLESELFGHEKGAFTGAVRQKPGKFSLADKGTIFLDEIGELSKSMQAKLLRVLQHKEFARVGGETLFKVDVRIIAATNRDLTQMVTNGEFREDLYYRLHVIPILLPPLRERVEDIPILVDHFLQKISGEQGKVINGIASEVLAGLMAYRWPGNVRELENVIERMVTLTDGSRLVTADLPLYLRGGKEEVLLAVNEQTAALPPSLTDTTVLSWAEYEKRIIALALTQYGSYNAAGKALGLTHKTVAAKAQKYGIKKAVSWENGDI
ncbi:sigma 54-interacting transcriptional regulator [Sporomusa acidovorans]|uniref:HTH-type transcriptional regulatory protein TyrR n=1 Tax=Sporomusa acidovorans (strain ATCC 49682 / DSM 3132 / Mol) TaxID=1123286 RepID=A0ABZ3JBU1_SPOA4|nr:sigma 54-interacting transcriptional regulator [Sporomusa acidovorans]OZC22704.1 nitrogen fixation protein VnfA [Sporomusa acidovorans DSM 3132]SDE79274.1 phosphotransferase system HPr (HPr) family [Sporomusa acidovorans]